VPDALEASTLYAMGLLDDAIREHLDLKRRRGADPAEIERLEREALGPVRRGPERDARDEDLAHDDEFEPDLDEGVGEEPDSEPPNPRTAGVGTGGSSAHGEPRDKEVPFEHEPEAPRAAAPPPAHRSSTLPPGDETAELDVLAERESDEGEDVLEETPEFLQDAPDHDRLWFEQRPPRDG